MLVDAIAVQEAGEGDAVADLDLVGIERHAGLGQRLPGQAEADVARFLRAQVFRAKGLGQRRVDPHGLGFDELRYAVDGGVLVGGLGIHRLRQRRGAEAIAERAAQGEGRGEVVARGELAAAGVAAAVVIFLEACGHPQPEFLRRVQAQVDVACVAVAAELAFVFGGEGDRALGTHRAGLAGQRAAGVDVAAIEVRKRVVGLGLIAFVTVLQAPGYLYGLDQADVEGAGQVEVVGPLVEQVGVGVEPGRAGRAERGVEGFVGAGLALVAAEGGAQVPVPFGNLALATGSRLVVGFFKGVEGRGAVRVDLGDDVGGVGPAVILPATGIALAEGGERVQGQVVAHRQFGVVRDVDGLDLWQAVLLHFAVGGLVARVAGEIQVAGGRAGAGRGLHRLGVQCVVEEAAVVAQGQALVEGLAQVAAVAVFIVFAVLGADRAAVVALLEDDVDDPGDGVGAVLRRGAVTQHFDMVDGADGDHVQVHRVGAVGRGGVEVDHCAVVAAFAIDQHQHVGAVQAAQAVGTGDAVVGGAGRALGKRRQGFLQGAAQAGFASLLKLLAVDHVDRCRAAGDGTHFAAARAGDDHRVERGVAVGGNGQRGQQVTGEQRRCQR
ncbi:hypothetical protein D3C76_342880 [compost metagenome]